MTTTIEPGTLIHFLETGFTFAIPEGDHAVGRVSQRGQTLEVTEAVLEVNKDRHGHSFLDLADDPDGQIRRWGTQKFGVGKFPATESRWKRGSVEHEVERERRRVAAWGIPDEHERGEALRKVTEDFGRPVSKQVSTEYAGTN